MTEPRIDRLERRVDIHDSRIAIVERTLDRFRWMVAGFSTAGAIFGGVIVALLSRQ